MKYCRKHHCPHCNKRYLTEDNFPSIAINQTCIKCGRSFKSWSDPKKRYKPIVIILIILAFVFFGAMFFLLYYVGQWTVLVCVPAMVACLILALHLDKN